MRILLTIPPWDLSNTNSSLSLSVAGTTMPGGIAYLAACLRDMDYFLRYASYSLIADDVTILVNLLPEFAGLGRRDRSVLWLTDSGEAAHAPVLCLTATAKPDVIVDIRPDSATRGRWIGVELSADGRYVVVLTASPLVPGDANNHIDAFRKDQEQMVFDMQLPPAP